MKTLQTIREQDVFPEAKKQASISYWDRAAARAVLFDHEGNIALLHVSAKEYYKLPGGGIEEGETVEQGLMRECLEETGCKIAVGKEIGVIEEYRDKNRMHQTSTCFFGEVSGSKGETAFVGDEVEEGFQLLWVPLDTAIELVQDAIPKAYDGFFIQKRDLAFLQEAKKIE